MSNHVMSAQRANVASTTLSAIEPLVAAEPTETEQPLTISTVNIASGNENDALVAGPVRRVAKARTLRSTVVVVVPDDDDDDDDSGPEDRGVGIPPTGALSSAGDPAVVVPNNDVDRGVGTTLTDYYEPDFEDRGVGTSPPTDYVDDYVDDGDYEPDYEPDFEDQGAPPTDYFDYIDYEPDVEDQGVVTPPPTGTPSPAGTAPPTRASSPVGTSGANAGGGTLLPGFFRGMTPALFPPHIRAILGAILSAKVHRYYAITRGKVVGVFYGWFNVSPHVVEIPESIYSPHESFELAMAAFQEAFVAGDVAIIPAP